MKKYIKNKEGMALPMVLTIMTILMLFASSMAIYSYSSLRAVRYLSNEKKAYYLARAGVESGAFAYQQAVGAIGGENNETVQKLVDQAQGRGENGNKAVTTERVYLVDEKDPANENTPWENLKFTETQPVNNIGVLGYFDIEMGWGVDSVLITQESNDEKNQNDPTKTNFIKKEKAERVVVVKATAVCGFGDDEVQQTVSAFVIDPTIIENTSALYNEKGELKIGTEAEKVFNKKTEIIYADQLENKNYPGFIGFFRNLLRSLGDKLIKLIWPDVATGQQVDFYYKTSTGSLVLGKPAKGKNLTCNVNENGFYAFSATGDLFLDGLGINAAPGRRLHGTIFTPGKSNFVSIGLFGDEIVVDGDITMYAYVTDSRYNTQHQDNLVMLQNKFYMGTVLIGDANVNPPDRFDTVSPKDGGICVNGKAVPVNKIFFNGGVYLKVKTRWGSEETYKVFNSGDIAYFYGQYEETSNNGGQGDTTARGIDLMKYFVDAVLADAEGYHYGESVKKKMRDIRRMYYGYDENKKGDYKSYFTDTKIPTENQTRLVRKLQVSYKGKTPKVDGDVKNVAQLVPPSPLDEAAVIWGAPKYGSLFSTGGNKTAEGALTDAQATIDAKNNKATK